MPPPPIRDRKRMRTPALLDEEDIHHSDDDPPRQLTDDHPPRPGQAERKRELERNRRNLVNVRFIELEAELRRSAPRVDSATISNETPDSDVPPPAKGKRIDKEAVLKDAASRIAVQRRDLDAASARISAMANEIDNLRAEKVELRGDKSYLRNELETVRKEVQTLREDNINVWQAFRKASTLKDSLASDIAKIPAELFLRRGNPSPGQMASAIAVGNNIVQQSSPMSIPQIPPTQNAVQLPQQPSNLANTQQPILQQQPQPAALQTPHDVQDDPQPIYTSQPQNPASSPVNDSFLICSGPDEIGELFANYVPGLLQNLGTGNQNSSAPEAQNTSDPSNNPQAMPVLSTGNLSQVQGQQASAGGVGDDDPDANQASIKSESDEVDPFSDVAYCV